MCVIAKGQSFHAYFKLAGFKKLSAENTAKWMISTVEQVVKGDFKKANSFATDICNLKTCDM